MSQSSLHNKKQVTELLRKAYRKYNIRITGNSILSSLFILICGFLLLILAEQILYLPAPVKIIFGVMIATAAGFAFWKYRKRFTGVSFKQFYRDFSRHANHPELQDALDLEQLKNGNQQLVDAAILQSLSRIKPEKLSQSLSEYLKQSGAVRLHNSLLGWTAAALFVLILTSINFQDAATRSLTLWQSFEKPNPFSFAVLPGDTTIEQGSAFDATIQFRGNQQPSEVNFRMKTSAEEAFRNRPMEQHGHTYHAPPIELNNDIEYYIEMDGYRSKNYTVSVQLRPRFDQLHATIAPPAYTDLDTSRQNYPISQIRAYQGSELTFSGHLNKPIAHARVIRSDSAETISIQPDSSFTIPTDIHTSDTLRFYLEDLNGLTNSNPFQVIISALEDEYPTAVILQPEASWQSVNPTEVNIEYRASDDFGLTSARLYYELKRSFTEQPETGTITLERPNLNKTANYTWNLGNLDLRPRDELTFWITVWDNDAYNGHKSSHSASLTLTIPSLVDYFDETDNKEDNISRELEDISESFEETSRQYEEFKQKMRDNPEQTGYEEQQQLEQAQRQQQEVQKKVEELNKQFEELKKEMEQDNMLSEETQKAYEELQKLMKEIDDPALQEALQKMQEDMQNMNPEQLRKAMEELEFNEQLYQERLKRTIELFKKLKLNSDLDKLAQSFEDMARRESEKNTKPSATGDSTAANQLRQELKEHEQLKNQVDSLSKNTSPKNEKQVEAYQRDIQEQLEQIMEELQEKMQNEDGSTQGKSGESNQDGEQSDQQQNRSEQYQQMATKTKELMEGMSSEQMNINIAGLQYVLYSLLNLSEEQEDLHLLASDAENRSQAFVNYARSQRNVEEIFGIISDSLYALSADIPQFSNQINRKKLEVEKALERSLEQMAERSQNRASVASRESLGGINELAFMIANLLDQLQNASSGGGGGGGSMSMQQMMEQLQQSGQSQQQLNQRLQEMINDIQGERLTKDHMERLNQIAKEQNRIRKQIQEMQRSGLLDGDRLGSELQRMIEDMEDTINDLRGGATDPLMIERQQNILSRMLDAEKAMQERDEEQNEREGQNPENLRRPDMPEMTLEELEKKIRDRLNDPNFTKYSPDYQRLIQQYFELLKERQEQEMP